MSPRTDLLPVEQSDRDRAADLMETDTFGFFSPLERERVREGGSDGHILVQAFAAHRLAANSKVEWAEIVEAQTARLLSKSFTNGRNAGLAEALAHTPETQIGRDGLDHPNVLYEVWQALKLRCCADPEKAKRVVMMGEDDLRAALAAIPADPLRARLVEALKTARELIVVKYGNLDPDVNAFLAETCALVELTPESE